jgi:hypothetical protein
MYHLDHAAEECPFDVCTCISAQPSASIHPRQPKNMNVSACQVQHLNTVLAAAAAAAAGAHLVSNQLSPDISIAAVKHSL